MKKSVIATLTTAVIIVSFLGSIMFAQKAYGLSPDPASWYMTENGVLGTDSYLLYPYQAESTSIGLSKFGELIDNNTNVGIEYAGARDPWAEPPGPTTDDSVLPKNVWINGWMLSVTYNNSLNGLTNVWAAAMFGDLAGYGGPWLFIKAPFSCTYEWQESFRYPGYEISPAGVVTGTTLSNGGRKTNGTAITDPIKVIYNGPRKFIAQLTTHIWDINVNTGTPVLALVDLMFTIEFNKVSKQVIVIKEVKAIPHPKYEISPLWVYANGNHNNNASIASGMLCQLSDREEWDLGAPTFPATDPYSSYVHFYTTANQAGFYTDYNDMYTVLPTLPSKISVYVTGNVSLAPDIPVNLYGSAPSSRGSYDYAQIISNDLNYVGYAAYWPALSDWTADGGGGRRDLWYRPMSANDPHDTDAFNLVEPFLAPLTIGEWDFMLAPEHSNIGSITTDKQFRAVAVYGVTDLNDGDDADIGDGNSNVPDVEAMYMLDSVFTPWDLSDALDKSLARWVDKYAADGIDKQFYLTYSDQYPDRPYQWDYSWPFVNRTEFWFGDWYDYDSFAERVLINNTLQVPEDDYILAWNNVGLMYINFTKAPPKGSEVKILFSTDYYDSWNDGAWEWLTVGRDSAAIDSAGSGMVGTWVTWWNGAELRNSALDMQDTRYGPAAPSILSAQRPTLLPDRTGYRDANIGYNLGRLGLKDDWSCHVNSEDTELQGLPISSSNIITVGGPAANALTEYTNDFSDAMATLGGWTGPGAPAAVIYSIPCWSKNTYTPHYDGTGKQTVGYGIISTFQDLNGTTFLVIYGYTGQDTYYTCWSLMHSDVLDLAFDEMPEGVTSLVLGFNYTLHPTDYCFVTIAEALGTISEYDYQGYFLNTDSIETITLQQVGPIYPGWPDYPIWVTDKFPAIHVDP